MSKSMKNDSKARSDESVLQMMDKMSKSLLIVTFILAVFLAFGGADFLATNLGINKWIPIGLAMIAVLAAFTDVYFKFVRIESAPQQIASTESQ